ncbi:MAG: hypothetical protein ABIT08_10020, partial [Bacteroidia bacterium]
SFLLFKIIVPALFLFTIARHAIYLNTSSSELGDVFRKNKNVLQGFSKIYIIDIPSQSFFLYLKWNFQEITTSPDSSRNRIPGSAGLFCINRQHTSEFHFKPLDCFDQSCLAVIK